MQTRLLSRNRSFRNFLWASSVSNLGTQIFDITMPLYVWNKTQSPVALSAASIALNLPYFLMAPLTGYFVDHFNKRNVMLFSDLGQIVLLASFLFWDGISDRFLYPLLFTVFFAKTLMILFETVATFQLVPILVGSEDLAEANSWFLSSQRLIQILGPILGGLLLGAFGIQACIALNCLTFLATLSFVYTLKKYPASWFRLSPSMDLGKVLNPVAISQDFLRSLKWIWDSELFRPFVLVMFLWNLSSLCPNTPTLTYYFTAQHQLSPEKYGFLIALIGGGGILGFLVSASAFRRLGFQRAFVWGAIFQAACTSLALVAIPFPGGLALLFGISRIGGAVVSMGTFMLRQTEIPVSHMGSINTCLRMLFMSAVPLSAWLQGIMIERIGVWVSMVSGAVCLWGCAYYSRDIARAYRKEAPQLPAALEPSKVPNQSMAQRSHSSL